MDSDTLKDDVVTMLDVLNDENELADQAQAVLNGSDEKNCNGFQKRQALYSCLTCAPEAAKTDFSKSIGVCLACSFKCHEKHELVELYTKRDFRCDCGIKQGSIKCQLDPTKKELSEEVNKYYNQNFVGLYCLCHRPYPDSEIINNDEMIQCVVCEDWYHSGHLKVPKGQVPPSESHDEMICADCMTKHDFLNDYSGFSIRSVDPENSVDSSSLNVTSIEDSTEEKATGAEPGAKKIKLSDDACVRPKIETDVVKGFATFWKDGWRKQLCKCEACMKVYEEAKVEFLIDLEDTTQNYEYKGKQSDRPSAYMASLEALGSLPHVNQINAISGYNQMRDKLFEFLQTFVVNNQIVTEEDIQRFFRNMNDSNDQPSVSHQPHFCR